MKQAYLASAVLWLTLILSGSPAAIAQTDLVDAGNDPFQRYFVFHNSLDVPVYPVIQSPYANCSPGDTRQLRIIVNAETEGAGVPSKGTVVVTIPKTKPCLNGFYNASRIFILTAKLTAFESLIQSSKRTVRDNTLVDLPLCAGNACWAGISAADYGSDAPGQLLEYTIISLNPEDGSSFPNPNDTRGRPFIDFDVSYVDDAYLPVAMALGDTGATQFMGSKLVSGVPPGKTFNDRLTAFLTDPNTQWSRYAAFSPANWDSATLGNRTQFRNLVTRTDKLPSGNILVVNTQTGGGTDFYIPTWDGQYSRTCGPDPTFPFNRACFQIDHLTGNQCPDVNNVMQGCCDNKNFLIEGVLAHYVGTGAAPPAHYEYTNPTLDNIVARWTTWVGPTHNPCPTAFSEAPVLDKLGFCAAFKNTIDFIWNDFKATQCTSIADGTPQKNQCLVAAIIGYDKKSGYDPNKCKKCPGNGPQDCPAICTEETQRNESVQALLRSLPWTPSGSPSQCTACPGPSCPFACIFPPDNSPPPDALVYHHDKFLHFWAPYSSPFNLNPFARFVHNPDVGLDAPGAYSFSIDDFYGNFGGQASTLIIEVGGTSNMPNPEPFDPYKQYRVSWGPGWHHATVCGRTINVPPLTRYSKGFSVNMSFWKDGVRNDPCEVTLYATPDETQKFMKFKVTETSYSRPDTYTQISQPLHGLKGAQAPGTWANWAGATLDNDAYCAQFSTPNFVAAGKCLQANLSPGGAIETMVGISQQNCTDPNIDVRTRAYNAECGRPLMSLNLPPLGLRPVPSVEHDFNADGLSDILWQHTNGNVSMWLMNGPTAINGNLGLGNLAGWVPTAADFNGDGKADIMWQHTDGNTVIWLMDSGIAINGNITLGNRTGWTSRVGDFNGDGKADILWQHTSGITHVWLMDASQPGIVLSDIPLGKVVGWTPTIGDFNGDGNSDILWQDGSGNLALWHMNGGHLLDPNISLGNAAGWKPKIGDFNGDGKADIVWLSTAGNVALWLMNGHDVVAQIPFGTVPTDWSIVEVADFNGDGFVDILWQDAAGHVTMWLTNGGSFSLGNLAGWTAR